MAPLGPISHFPDDYIESLLQDCSDPIANALQLLQSCTKPWITLYIAASIRTKDFVLNISRFGHHGHHSSDNIFRFLVTNRHWDITWATDNQDNWILDFRKCTFDNQTICIPFCILIWGRNIYSYFVLNYSVYFIHVVEAHYTKYQEFHCFSCLSAQGN